MNFTYKNANLLSSTKLNAAMQCTLTKIKSKEIYQSLTNYKVKLISLHIIL